MSLNALLTTHTELKLIAKAANIGFLASTGALIASNIIKNHNIKAADKTANERGFLSTKDRMKIKNVDVNYMVTDEIYKSHVN